MICYALLVTGYSFGWICILKSREKDQITNLIIALAPFD
jgi:hypothetical protein